MQRQGSFYATPHQRLVINVWKPLYVLASLLFGEQAGRAAPRRISSSPVPQTPPLPDGMCKEPPFPIGPGTCPSTLIPDTLMGR